MLQMERKKTLTMNWAGLGDINVDDDRFFESHDRISTAAFADLFFSGSDDDDHYDDSRMSFSSTISSGSREGFRMFGPAAGAANGGSLSPPMMHDFNMWMAEPESIKDRRKRLLQGMGLSDNKELLRLSTTEFKRGASKKLDTGAVSTTSPSPQPEESKQAVEPLPSPSPLPLNSIILVRSRSDGDIETSALMTKKRKEHLEGKVSKQHLTRTYSELFRPCGGYCGVEANFVRVAPKESRLDKSSTRKNHGSSAASYGIGAFFLIKNLDTGKEFIVNEFDEEGMWNRLSDIQTGKQLTREEFEKCVGYSPVVKELMRRENIDGISDYGGSERKVNVNSYLSKSFRNSKKRGAAFLKNIKGVANSISSRGLGFDKEKEISSSFSDHQKANGKNSNSEWIKVRQHGKSYKELTALRLCQEIQAHEGSIWTIKFSLDAHYLASAGEDRVIHVWEVQECEVMSEDGNMTNFSSGGSSPDLSVGGGEAQSMPIEKKRGKNSSSCRKGNSIPDYVYEPETVFSLSEKPVCSFTGHLDDVLDLSWSKSQLFLSSSMDKTVRLWDLESKSCLKLFAHNDYVTCIQFNPADERYFISGSLDAKVRIWSIPDRKVVDWTDLHEMVTAACYTPDGMGAVIGSHKGRCRTYDVNDCKLDEIGQIDLKNKKSQGKKITGLQFAPGNTAEMLITSADSRIRVYDGSEVTHKYRGFRNTSSQIAASYTLDGRYIVSASEDSQVHVWRSEEHRKATGGKSKGIVNTISREYFPCRDVSVAIPWPSVVKGEKLPMPVHSKCISKRSSVQQAAQSSFIASPTREEGNPVSKRSNLPPLLKKAINNTPTEGAATCSEDDPANISRTNSEICNSSESFNSASIRYGDSSACISSSGASSSQSWSSSWNLFDVGHSHGSHPVHATAWGMVIVTATVGGEIRAYQNFGLPVRNWSASQSVHQITRGKLPIRDG